MGSPQQPSGSESVPRPAVLTKEGNLDKLGGEMSPGKTVSKPRSTPAPYLAQAPAPKLGVGVGLNRCRERVGCLLGPDTVLTRSRPHRGTARISARCGLHISGVRGRFHRLGRWEARPLHATMAQYPQRSGAVERNGQRDDWGVEAISYQQDRRPGVCCGGMTTESRRQAWRLGPPSPPGE